MLRTHKFLSLIVAAAVGLTALTGCGSAVAPSNEQPRTISVTGNGYAYGKPDTASASLGVQTRNADPALAVDENTRTMTKLMSTLQELGIAEKDIQTSNFSVSAMQDYTPDGQPSGKFTYVVDNTVTITIRDLAKVGDVLGKAVGAGANNVYGVSFSVSDAAQLEAQAREKAMADAKSRAEQMARAAGVTLDKPLSISEYTSGPIPYVANYRADAMAQSGAPVPVASGQIQMSLQVNLVYTIK